MERTGNGGVRHTLMVPNDTQHLAEVREAVQSVVSQSAFPARDARLIVLAVDEAVTNIMEHAYEEKRTDQLDIEMVLAADATKFEVVIRDSGKHFNPDEIQGLDIEEHVREGRKNGLGIFLMRKIMDEVNYKFKQGVQNELRMVKYVGGKTGKPGRPAG